LHGACRRDRSHRIVRYGGDAMESVMPPSPAPTERTATLNARRELTMARSAHAYVRGSTERFYEWIRSSAGRRMPLGPPVTAQRAPSPEIVAAAANELVADQEAAL
jgi:hypothetical protein